MTQFAQLKKKLYLCSRFGTSMISLDEIRRPVEKDFQRFDETFQAELKHDNNLLQQVLTYILSKRGKQIRPLLVLLSAQICHGVTDKTIQTAVALELIHNASLLHDDVVDNSPTRRGAEAVQKRWSNKIAILTGDYIFARVMELTTQIRNTPIMTIFAQMSETLSEGELIELHNDGSMWIDEATYFSIIEKKTACLFAACTESGAESSCGSMRQTTALREYGLALGMCFQIKDDILDYSDAEELGKPTMNDIRDGKATLPLIISLKRAPKAEADEIRSLAERIAAKDSTLNITDAEQEIKSFVMRYDGIRYAYHCINEQKEKAIKALSCFHDSSAKKSLLALLDYSINRLH